MHDRIEHFNCCWDSAWQVQHEFDLDATLQSSGWSVVSALPCMCDAATVAV